jgi:hypothetical protein
VRGLVRGLVRAAPYSAASSALPARASYPRQASTSNAKSKKKPSAKTSRPLKSHKSLAPALLSLLPSRKSPLKAPLTLPPWAQVVSWGALSVKQQVH